MVGRAVDGLDDEREKKRKKKIKFRSRKFFLQLPLSLYLLVVVRVEGDCVEARVEEGDGVRVEARAEGLRVYKDARVLSRTEGS